MMNGQMNLKYSINNFNHHREKDQAEVLSGSHELDNQPCKILNCNNNKKTKIREEMIYYQKKKKL